MRVLFDAGPLVNSVKSGVGYFTYGLLDNLATQYPDIQIVAHYFNFMGRRKNVNLPDRPNIRYVESRIMPGKILNLLRKVGLQLPAELLFKSRGDVAIYPNFVSLPSITRIPSVVVVHDFCFVDIPQYVSAGNRKFLQKFVRSSISSAAGIVAISKSTKQAVERHYHAGNKTIVSLIPPVNKLTDIEESMDNVGQNFILFISTLEPRKNVIGLVKGYEALPKNLRDKHPLVLAGGLGWDMDDDLAYIKKLQESGYNIVLTGYISDSQKEWLYKNASVLAVPSHYEGFGMPILEAMVREVPTAVSDIEVFHEVAGDATLYFDKDNPTDVSDKLEQVISDTRLRKDLKQKGLSRVSEFSWQDTTARVYNLLINIAKPKV